MSHISAGSCVAGQSLPSGSGPSAVLQAHLESVVAQTKNLRVERGETVDRTETEQQQAALTQHLNVSSVLKTTVAGGVGAASDLAVPGGLFSLAVDLPVTKGDMNRWEQTLNAEKQVPAVITMEQLTSAAATAAANGEAPQTLAHLSPIPVFDPSKHQTATMKEKMAHNKKWRAHRRGIPIFNVKDESLISGFRDNHILSVLGDAGTGKTLQLPQVLIETDICKKKRVLLVMRTPVAAVAVSQRLTEECGPLAAVGVATGNLNNVADSTQIVVTTAAVVCRALVADRNLANVGAVILDEAHDQHIHPCPFTELLLAVLREQLKDHVQAGTASEFPRLVLTVTGDPVGEHTLFQYFREESAEKKQLNIHRLVVSVEKKEDGDAAPSAASVLDLEQIVHWSVSDQTSMLPVESAVQQAMESNAKDGAKGIAANALLQSLTAAPFSARLWSNGSSKWLPFLDGLVNKVSVSMKGKGVLLVLLPTSAHVQHLAASLANSANLKVTSLHDDLLAAPLQKSMEAIYEETGDKQSVVVATASLALSLVDHSKVAVVLDSTRTVGTSFNNALGDVGSAGASVGTDDRLEVSQMDTLKATRRFAQSADLDATIVIHLVIREEMQKVTTVQTASQQIHPYVQTEALEELVLVTKTLLPTSVAKPTAWLGSKLRQVFVSTSAMAGSANTVGISANKDHITKLFAHAEERIIKMGFLDRSSKVPTLFGCAAALQCQPLVISRLIVLSAMFETSSVAESLLVASTWLVGLPAGKSEVFAAAKRYFTTAQDGSGSDFDAVVGMWKAYCEVKGQSSELAEFYEVLQIPGAGDYFDRIRSTFEVLADARVRLFGNKYAVNPPGCNEPAASAEDTTQDACISTGAESLLALALYPNIATTITVAGTNTTFAFSAKVGKSKAHGQGALASMLANSTTFTPSSGSVLGSGATSHSLVGYTSGGMLDSNSAVGVVGDIGSVVAGPLVVFCGEGNRSDETLDQRAPRKTRGFLPAVTTAWRHTRAATSLPPPSQKEPKPIPAQLVETVQEARTHMTVDSQASFAVNRTAADFLIKLRDQSRRLMNALLQSADGPLQYATQVREVREALEWVASRERGNHAFHRNRRSDAGAQKPDAPVRSLLAPFVFSYDPGRPRSTGVTASANSGAPGSKQPVAQVANVTTYTGRDPTPQEKVMITRVISIVQKAGTRSKEKELLSTNAKSGNKLFDFLNPENELYPYYSDKLRQVAPELAWLGDDLPALETFLKELEVKVGEEIAEDREQEEKRKAQDRARMERNEERKKIQGSEAGNKSIFGALGRVGDTQHKFQEAAGDELLEKFVQMTGGSTTAVANQQAEQATLDIVLGGNKDSTEARLGGGLFAGGPGPSGPSAPVAMPTPMPGPNHGGGPAPILTAAQQRAENEAAVFQQLPPKLPNTAFTNHYKPSVLVFPLPPKERQLHNQSMPLPLVLVRALGEKLGIKVGPSLIVGEWARIEVPNSMVENRCLEMNWFFCLGCKLKIVRNDRIFDNPDQGGGARFQARFQQIKGSLEDEKKAPVLFTDNRKRGSTAWVRDQQPGEAGDDVDSISDISDG